MNLLIGFPLPLLMFGLKTMQPRHLVRAVNQIEESLELSFNLLIGLMQRLKEDGIVSQKETTQTGLLVDHQFDQAVGMENDDVGAIDRARTGLNAFEAVTENESQNSQCCNRQRKKTEQKSAIKLRFHSVFPCLVWR